MFYVAISDNPMNKNLLFWDKKAKAFVNKLPNKCDAYKKFSCASTRKSLPQSEWYRIVDEHVANGGRRDEISLHTIGEETLAKYEEQGYYW